MLRTAPLAAALVLALSAAAPTPSFEPAERSSHQHLEGDSAPRFAPSFISNTAFRTTTTGAIVGAQDGNVVNTRGPGGEFYLAGILYGDCPFTACANESQGACGFGPGSVRVWSSPDLSQVGLVGLLNWRNVGSSREAGSDIQSFPTEPLIPVLVHSHGLVLRGGDGWGCEWGRVRLVGRHLP